MSQDLFLQAISDKIVVKNYKDKANLDKTRKNWYLIQRNF